MKVARFKMQGVSKKPGESGSTDSFVIGFSRLRPFFKSTYNFPFKEPNFRLVDLKMVSIYIYIYIFSLNVHFRCLNIIYFPRQNVSWV